MPEKEPHTLEAEGNGPPSLDSTVPPWPYHRRTNILDRELAASIRRWALSDAAMSEAELHSYSQRQLLRMYLTGYLEPTLRRVLGGSVPGHLTPAAAEAGANRVLFDQSSPADRVERMLWEAVHEGGGPEAAHGPVRKPTGTGASPRG
jgi:hypothetical protein